MVIVVLFAFEGIYVGAFEGCWQHDAIDAIGIIVF